ncbi:PREDICTED: aminopeptidase N-like [Acromyrmex echinatior]|nr:PREDICTED: aminopeptidase N-like [Acromyrmex echinatior]
MSDIIISNHSPFFLLLLIIFFALNLTFAHDNDGTNKNENSSHISARYRLPKEIVPISYDLSIYTHPIDANYDGHVRIILQVLEKTDFIVLHTDALKIQTNASLFDRSGRLTRILRYIHDEDTQMLMIKLERALDPMKYTLEVSFKGRIANDVFGFYASLYEVDGRLRRIGVTQFSPTYARRAFPCMDEPYLKAEFHLHIGHHKDQKATSNTPVESIRIENDTYYVTTFHRTPRMPTYLVGWAVHNFVPEQSQISGDFKMWTRDSMKFHGSMALNRGWAVYSALQMWLLVKSPLVKVDQFAIPDFNFNAMENWGLITYRESVVLHEDGTPTRKVVNGLSVMAHEYAHSWFGNLVTPVFWDVVWLKEGFATYFQYFGVSLVEPDLRMMNVFVVDCLQPILLADSNNHTRTLNGQEVGDRNSIMALFDFVSYEKGASIIRMISHTIGSTTFQLGLQNYLRELSFKAATPFDLYRHLQAASNITRQLYKGISIKDVIESWANQPGYPLVIITRNYKTMALFASQERFYLNHQAAQTNSEKSSWWIPLTFVTEESNSTFNRTTTAAWLKPQAKNMLISSVKPNSWVIFNVQQVGYYRVTYDENNWKMLIRYLKLKNFQKIHVINRAALLDDAFNLARAGYVDYSIPFDLAIYLTRETEYEPWVAAVNNFNFLNHILACSPRVQRLFQNYANNLLKPMSSLLSFMENPMDSSIKKMHRELILSTACSVNNMHCLKTSKTLFKTWILSEKSIISANLKSFVYCVGIRAGDDNDWHTVWNRFLHTDLHAEQELLLSALGCTKTPHLIDRFLNASIIYRLKLRKQYRMTIINAVLNGNPENVNYAIDFIHHNLPLILKSRGIDFLTKMLTAVGNKIVMETQLNKLRSFVNENIENLGSALNSAKKAISTMLTMRFLLSLMLVLATCWASYPSSDDVAPQLIEEVLDNYRLPLNVIPTEYDIKLQPIFESSNQDNFTFKGESVITLFTAIETNTIIFHAKEINITEKSIKLTDKKENKIYNITELKEDINKDFVILIFKDLIPAKKNIQLSLHYTGKLNDKLRGFYRSSYQNKEGKKIWLATTHFEPVSARQAFPCWDEPQFKAHFTITITVPQKNYIAISNMPEKKTENLNTIFEKTPPMSTYLVAFVVSDFTSLQNNKNFRVWAKPTVEKDAKEFALKYGLETLQVLKNFTNIDYYGKEQGMSKLDQIAIPDFAAGAMENWGLVTYRESRLLYIENKTTTEEKQALATIIAHELSHQWFGNLVTCIWWNYIWLNEGFATFFQYYITDKVIPQLYKDEKSWRLMEQFVIKNVQASAFVVDASSKTRALNPKTSSIQTTAQIRSLFDDIAYKKGASILYMIQGFLSEDVFQEGLKKYLNDYKGKSVDSNDFFKSVQTSTKKVEECLPKSVTLTQVMDNWVNKPGYPVITVTWNKKLPGTVNITQERFFSVKPVKEDKTQWYIPINYVTEESPEKVMPTDKKSRWLIPGTNASIDKLNDTKWILFNKNQTGFYRVNYDNSNWQKLASYLNSPSYLNISATNRAQLIDDALNLARTGHLAYEIALQITLYLSHETDYIPWYTATRAFNYLDTVLISRKNYTNYQKYVAEKIKSFALTVNYTDLRNSTHVDKLAKVLALNTACKYGLEDCNNFANEKLADWLDNKTKEDEKKLLPDLRRGILCAGLRNASPQIWNATLQKYKTTKDKDEKADILAGLGCATSKETIQKFLALTLEKDSDIDIFAALNSICAGNAESFDILIEFIKDKIETIHNADKEDNSLLNALLNHLSDKVVTTKQYGELSLLIHRQLQDAQKLEVLSVAINKLAWINTHRDDVETWIVKNCETCNENKPDSSSACSITLSLFLPIILLLLTRFY